MSIPYAQQAANTGGKRHTRPLRILVCGSTHSGKTTLAARLEGTGRVLLDLPGPRDPGSIATAAATADLALIVVGAGEGLCSQTRHEAHIAVMLGIRHVVLVVNKMDAAGFQHATFDAIETAFRSFATALGDPDIQAIPLSALQGDNLQQHSTRMGWHAGPTLLQHLDGLAAAGSNEQAPFRMPLMSATQDESGLRKFTGIVASGSVRPGAALRVLPAGLQSSVNEVFTGDTVVDSALTGTVVTVTLTDTVAASRGDVLVAADAPPEVADQFEARLLWISAHAMTPGRQYLLQLATSEVTATITEIKYREDTDSGAQLASKTLERNEIATVNLSTNAPLVFESYRVNRTLGCFVLLDKLNGERVGAGSIDFALRRASNIHWQALELHKAARAGQKQQTPRCIWFTGLSGSGKSTLANLLEKRLYAEGRHTYLLDGDNVRHGLNRDLGFTEADRVENIRRVAEVAKLMVDAGLIVLVSFISPFRSERQMARELFAADEFVEVYVDTPIEVCEQRDVKGLYAKARKGELKNFTGIDSPYEAPLKPEVRVDTSSGSLEDCVAGILQILEPGN